MDSFDIICVNCESEFRIKEIYSDHNIHYCPYCGEEIEVNQEEE